MIECLKPVIQKVADFQLAHYQSKELEFTTKSSPSDFVSEVDIISQDMIVKEIKKKFPGAGILGEEGYQSNIFDSELLFVIDPLDGTSNYRSKLDCWAISVGLLKEGKLHEGCLAFPMAKTLICSNELVSQYRFRYGSSDNLFLFGADRIFEYQTFPFKNLKKRIFGATVPTIYYCFKKAFPARPGLDFALLGTSKLWDIAGVAACLKQIGGSLLDFEGTELLESDLLAKYTCQDKSVTKAFPIIASADPEVTSLVLDFILTQQNLAFKAN